MKANTGFWASFFVLLTTACGGGEEEVTYEWKCYERADFDNCECYEVASGEDPTLNDMATEVDDCSGYEVCMSYYDTLREEGRCDCGGVDFEPNLGETQRSDTKTVDSCPVSD